MRSKPIRKNAHKERIFTQRQNIQDFDYTKSHRGQVDGKVRNSRKRNIAFVVMGNDTERRGTMKTAKTTNRMKKFAKNPSDAAAAQATPESGRAADPNVFAQRVEKKAFELYEKRGCQNGRDCDDWYEAEKIVEAEMIAGK
jgi:hypothetical protein